MRSTARLLLPCVLAGVLATSAPGSPSPVEPVRPSGDEAVVTAATDSLSLHDRIRDFFGRTNALRRAGRADTVFTATDALEEEAVAAGDTFAVIQLRAHRGRTLNALDRYAEAERAFAAALRLAEAHGDSTLLLEPLYRMVLAIDAQGRPPRVVPWMERLVARAVEADDPAYEARGRMLLARRALREGRTADARAGLERAAEVFSSFPEGRHDLPGALLLLGNTYANEGDWDRARSHWRASADTSRTLGDPFSEANALVNLGILESMVGDPAAAIEHQRRAHRILRANGRLRAASIAASSAAIELARLGRFDEAETLAEESLSHVRTRARADLEAMAWRTMAAVHHRRGTHGAEAAAARAALAAARRRGAPDDLLQATVDLARSLAERDSARTALELLDASTPAWRERASAAAWLDVERTVAALALRTGDPDRARRIVDAAAVRADSLGLWIHRLPLAVLAVEVEIADGLAGAARIAADRALALWEERRLVTTDPEWREAIGLWTPRLGEALVETARLGDDAAIRSWEDVQRLRTRTLLERMRGLEGPEESATPGFANEAPTLAQLRARLDGRPLVEVFWGHRRAYVWTVDADSVRLRALDDPEALADRIDRLRSLLEDPRSDLGPSGALALGRSLGRQVFEDSLPPGTWLVPDGPLHRLPPALLLPEARPTAVPSAAVLVAVRRERSDAPARKGLAVLGGDVDARGRSLAGAGSERAWLVDRLGAEEIAVGDGPLPLDERAAVHVAAHATIDDNAPWRSGVLLSSLGGPRWWRAREIARDGAVGDLIVLSTCESAGGRVFGGEGMLGLTQAFLAAGARTVVATAWPVDDGVALVFSRSFYAALGRGDTVGEAAHRARTALREEIATSHPSHWAAWMVVGDPDARLHLDLRSEWSGRGLLGAALLVLGIALGAMVLPRRIRR